MKSYLTFLIGTLLIGALLLTGCDEIHFTKPQVNAGFGFEISGEKMFRLNRENGQIDVYWPEAGKLKHSTNYTHTLTYGDSLEDENGKKVYYIGKGQLADELSDSVMKTVLNRTKEDSNHEEQNFQLRFIRDMVLTISEVSGLVRAYVNEGGQLKFVSEEPKKLFIGMLLLDEKGEHLVYIGNGTTSYSNDKVIEAIMRKYP